MSDTSTGEAPALRIRHLERELTDALVEIDAYEALVRVKEGELAKLRAITEAEPTAWAWTDPGHRDWYCRKGYPHDIAKREGATIVPLYAHMARALAVVAPKGETE